MTARELADKKYGTKDLKDISEFIISLDSAVSMMEEYKNRGKNLPIFSVIARYFLRALGLPFFMILSLIGALRGWISYGLHKRRNTTKYNLYR